MILVQSETQSIRKWKTYLWIAEMIECLLVCRVCLLKVIHHQVTMSKASPYVSVIRVELEYVVDIIYSLVKLFLMTQYSGNSRHSLNRSRVVAQSMLVGGNCFFLVA